MGMAERKSDALPRVLVLTGVFPHSGQPHIGLFVRERMFRVADRLPTSFVVPIPWFPGQSIIRRYRPGFRPPAPRRERQRGIDVLHPRFLSVPGIGKRWDGLLLALGALPTLRRLRRNPGFDILDAHFGYPDGYAATLLGCWLNVPVTVTVRGNEEVIARNPSLRPLLARGLRQAARVFSVSDSLRRLTGELGVDPAQAITIPNGVDSEKFFPMPKAEARQVLGLPDNARVLVSVGGLVEGKGFHRVIERLPALRGDFPGLRYLIAGGATPVGDWRPRLERQVRELGLDETVTFLGPVAPEKLRVPLSAADAFVLATAREGWANVFLEAMACGLPVVTTRVGGNPEVVSDPRLGTLVPFGDPDALEAGIREALRCDWDRGFILSYARANTWDRRIDQLVDEFRKVLSEYQQGKPPAG